MIDKICFLIFLPVWLFNCLYFYLVFFLTDITEVPTKCISYYQTLDINASVQFIDFEGRSDSESIKKILGMIKPRRLIIVRGSTDATETLASYCTSGAVQGKVFTPHLLEIVDATTESHIYQVSFSV